MLEIDWLPSDVTLDSDWLGDLLLDSDWLTTRVTYYSILSGWRLELPKSERIRLNVLR